MSIPQLQIPQVFCMSLHSLLFLLPQTWYSADDQPSVRFEFSCCVTKLQSSQKLKVENKLKILFSFEYSCKLLHLTDCAGSLYIYNNAELINWQRRDGHILFLKSSLEISVRLQSISAERGKSTQHKILFSNLLVYITSKIETKQVV